MSNTKYDAIIQLIPFEPLKFMVILFLTSSKEVKEKAFKGAVWVGKQAIKHFPKLKNKLASEFKTLKEAMPEESDTSKKLSAWGAMTMYVCFSTVMVVLIGIVILSLALAAPNKLTFFKVLLAVIYVVFFGSAAWLYRASAHLTANEKGINKYPWRKKAAS